ncbi:acyltransferase family protein [Prauserella flavalba]|uniref:Acyltransferase 3 domain-containing protein n=1 Tax=Prauserella flavalba TaxID=1477506 RepID=A0A318LPP8_9PSEU|nr:acyltransferase [Prauserella flavalba]PXY36522.1 hypothetical protein BA062_14130 [Prauserella flavalba]
MVATPERLGAERLAAADNLRAMLVAWIIGGHALLGYSAIGGWAYDELNEVTFSPGAERVLITILGPSALFFLGAFFLIAGLFTPGSRERRGTRAFVTHRTVRLGIPFLASLLLVWPLTLWLAYRATGEHVSYWWLLTGRPRLLDSGSLWFVAVLLIFSFAYATVARPRPARAVPGGRTVLGLVLVLALTTFAVRLWVAARDRELFDLHVWLWPQLAAMFWLGAAQAHTGLASRVPDRLYRCCGVALAGVVLSVPVLAVAAGVTDVAAGSAVFLGGPRWEALLFATVEAALVVPGSIWLLGVAQRHLHRTSGFASAAARASFAAFILQGPVLIALATAARPLPMPAGVKAPLVAVCAIACCFGLGRLAVTRTPLGALL